MIKVYSSMRRLFGLKFNIFGWTLSMYLFGAQAWDFLKIQGLMIGSFWKNSAIDAWNWVLGSKPNDMFTIGGGVIFPMALIGPIPVGFGPVGSFDRYVMPDGSVDWYVNIGLGVGLAGANAGFDSGSVIPQSSLLLNKQSIKGLSTSVEGALAIGVGAGGEVGAFGNPPDISEDPDFGFRKAGPRVGSPSFQVNVTGTIDIGQ